MPKHSIHHTSRATAALLVLSLMEPALSAERSKHPQDHDRAMIEETLNDYIIGTSFSEPGRIREAFNPEAVLLLDREDQPIWQVPVETYAAWFERRERGEPTGRIGNILQIDVDGDIATAKAEILVPAREIRYVDLFLLKRLDDGWQIISKTADSAPSEKTGQRVLFIVSAARYHGDTDIPAGVSFSETYKAYQVFEDAGYTVDIVSPEGGPVPLAYINMSDPAQMSYIYDTDFMEKLGHTKSPQEIEPSEYEAVQYIGGANAMYGVHDNAALQAITMAIYEGSGGVISAVCHGTAGITQLRESDGDFLVAGKNVTGYPEAYEKIDADYFKAFPFLMQETIEERGGSFSYGPPNRSHVVTDGRLVTGQNHMSSKDVSEEVIRLLRESRSAALANGER